MGSSPRGRGKRKPRAPQRAIQGLIPAWAGKTRLVSTWPEKAVAHPRVGGENLNAVAGGNKETGSSPRGRGKPVVGGHGDLRPGLIPAWAGKTTACGRSTRPGKAHPRVGGENSFVGHRLVDCFGSYPRGRGKRTSLAAGARGQGLIPAWAGKTLTRGTSRCTRRAHPRVGGENPRPRGQHTAGRGSSPRGRGKRPAREPFPRPERLIPAWAGKTSVIHSAPPSPWAHPRVGGENITETYATLPGQGSSPRGRGKPHVIEVDQRAARLIPAWAGKTPLL